MNSNPFAGLFAPVNDAAATFSPQTEVVVNKPSENTIVENEPCKRPQAQESTSNAEDTEKDELLDELIADVFGITLYHEKKKKPTRQLVFIDTDSVEHAIFERLLLIEPESALIAKESTKGQDLDSHVVQTEIVPYLFESYCRLQRYRISDGSYDTVENIRKIIMRDISTALQEPDVFVGQEVSIHDFQFQDLMKRNSLIIFFAHLQIHAQFLTLFLNGGIVGTELSSFIGGIVEHICSENKGCESETITSAFSPILDIIHKETTNGSLLISKQYWFGILQTFASLEPLAKLVISHSTVKNNIGKAYGDTLLGSLLSLSCLPKTATASFDFFDKPFQQV